MLRAKQLNQVLHRPQPIRDPSCHRRSNPEGLVDANEVIVHVVNGKRREMITEHIAPVLMFQILELVKRSGADRTDALCAIQGAEAACCGASASRA